MDQTPLDRWNDLAAVPFTPAVSKEYHFVVAFVLLLTAFVLSGIFALNRTFWTLSLLGIPASLAFGFGTVYMMCAVGVYV